MKLCGANNFSKQFLKLEDTNLINKMEKETMEAWKLFPTISWKRNNASEGKFKIETFKHF